MGKPPIIFPAWRAAEIGPAFAVLMKQAIAEAGRGILYTDHQRDCWVFEPSPDTEGEA